jgi:hypothetical protein
MLHSSALDLEALLESPNKFHSEVYFGEIIRLLRDRLPDPLLCASDATMGSVAVLAAAEVSEYIIPLSSSW